MSKRERTAWTPQQRYHFEVWHELRMATLGYPPEIVAELTQARESWLSSVRIKENPDEVSDNVQV